MRLAVNLGVSTNWIELTFGNLHTTWTSAVNLHSVFNSEKPADLQLSLKNDIYKFIDFRYYRRFYLDDSSTIEDAIEDFIVTGWEAGHNLNPILHTEFVRNYYSDELNSLSDFIALINRPIFPNALCSKEVRPQDLRKDVQNELNYTHLNHYFSFDVLAYALQQNDVAENPHFQSIVYHLFFVGLSQNRLRKFGYLKDLHYELDASDLDCLVSQKEPFHLDSFYQKALLYSDVFDLSFYRRKYNLEIDKKRSLFEHFCVDGWSKNYDPHPYVHSKFIKLFYNLSSDASGFDKFMELVQTKFIPNALIKRPINFFELSKCLDSFDIDQQSQLFSIDIKRLTRDRYSILRHAKISALKHLYLFGLEENILSTNGYFKEFFLPRLSGVNDYEFLSGQARPLGLAFSSSDPSSNTIKAKENKVVDNLLIGVVLYCNTSSEINRLLTSILNNICDHLSEVLIIFYDNSPNQNCLQLSELDQSKLDCLNVELIHDSTNCGFSVAHNRLMKICFSKSNFMYLGLNPDGYLLPGSLERAHAFLTHKQKSFLCEMNTEPIAHPKWYDPKSGLTDWVSGVAFFIDESAFNLLKGFDDSFPLYCEDVDLSFRAYGCDVSLYVTPFFGFYHDTTDRIYGKTQNSWRSVKSLIGEWYLCLKWGNLERALDLERLMYSRGIDFSQLPERPERAPVVHNLVYDLVRSQRYSRSLY